jgi:hypothetical protein
MSNLKYSGVINTVAVVVIVNIGPKATAYTKLITVEAMLD